MSRNQRAIVHCKWLHKMLRERELSLWTWRTRTHDPLLEWQGLCEAHFDDISLKRIWLVDVAGIEPATPCLQSKRKFNLSRCFGCAYQFEGFSTLLQSCSKARNTKKMSRVQLQSASKR